MADDKTYLELSEGNSHKFYELTISGSKLTTRFGRIGDQGQTQVESFGSPAEAKAAAESKANAKKKKGYGEAVMGQREKRPVSRRPIESHASSAKNAPLLWKFKSGAQAFGIFVDANRAWIGNEDGSIYALDHDGEVQDQFRLPEGVKCLVGDEDWRYAGCDDGKVYDLTGKTPREAYEMASDVNVLWLDIASAILAVSDDQGNVAVVDHEGEKLWQKKAPGDSAWMVRADKKAVYQGYSNGVTAWSWSKGKPIWNTKIKGNVWFGWQEKDNVYACTTEDAVHTLDKKTGKIKSTMKCDDRVYSCAASPDGKNVFAADTSSSLYCFDEKGKRLWKLGIDCGSALSMQFYKDRLYVVTNDGFLGCIDASATAIANAEQGKTPVAKTLKAPKAVAVASSARLETARNATGQIELECVDEKGKLRVKVVSPGYHSDWHVQFPRNLRQKGARFVVAEVKEASTGGFYRALGEIRRLA